MNKELPKAYEPVKYEDEIYGKWEKSGFFNPDKLTGELYSIMMPPPNVTGVLHLGHALENSLMDIMARYQRMRGKKVLLLPGTDHAAVATQAKVEKILVGKGIKNPREHFGREKLLEKIREYAENSKTTILKQIRKMGTSCDWSRLAYTFDEARSRAVNEVFVRMYNDGLIYRGFRVVNWSVKGQSTCSDDELVYIERPAKLYTFKYSKDFPISIATTRPETKLGDTAVAVHPEDKRYKKYIGRVFEANIGAARPLKIKIIADENVDPKFGTGAIGVTPAHSAVDFEMYEKQKTKNEPIELIQVIGQDGRMTDDAGSTYYYLTVLEAREKLVAWLKKNNLLEKEEDIMQSVGTSDRFGDIVEALPMTQWFIDVNKRIPGKNKSLKDLMREAVAIGHKGDAEQRIKITPERFEKIYFNWIDNLRDWCVSRQIWWGHRIPAWYCMRCSGDYSISIFTKFVNVGETKNVALITQKNLRLEFLNEYPNNWEEKIEKIIVNDIKDNIVVSFKKPKCPKCGHEDMIQDLDTLDTWFSSGLWTFSTLGYPNKTVDLKTFHPTSWMQMGYEILFFWMARMILMSTYVLDEIPFRDVYIHGILRDETGKKFSKSAGNAADPLEVAEKYGTDALRLSLITGTTPGNDSRFYEEKVEGARNLVNKLWNVARYIITNSKLKTQNSKPQFKTENLTLVDNWILGKFDNLIKEATDDLNNYQFSQVAEKLRAFTWDDLADWYLEACKFEKNEEKNEISNFILKNLLKLWHPFIPFVTEAIWSEINKEKMLIVENWPLQSPRTPLIKGGEGGILEFDIIKNIIIAIRNARAENKVEPAKKIKAVIYAPSTGSAGSPQNGSGRGVKELIKSQAVLIKSLRTGIEELEISEKGPKIDKTIYAAVGDIEIYLIGALDEEKEKKRIKKEIENLEKLIKGIEAKLKNKEFINKAPAEIVAKEKEKAAGWENELKKLKEQLKNL